MRASGAAEPYWRIPNGLRTVNGTGVPGRLEVVKIVFNAAANEFPVHRCAELIERMAYGQFRANVMNSSISTDCEGPRPRVAENVPGQVLRDDDRDVCMNQL
jgi:hypothetical protein